MNAPESRLHLLEPACPTLAELALLRLAPASAEAEAPAEARWLADLREAWPGVGDLSVSMSRWREAPPPADRALHGLVQALRLAPVEQLAVALALAVDTDPMAARAVGWLQAPLREMRPTVGLVAALQGEPGSLAALLDGVAVRSGVLRLLEAPERTLPDTALALPMPLVLAAGGACGQWPGVTLAPPPPQALPASLRSAAALHAARLADGVLVVRSAHAGEARQAAAAVAQALGRRAAFIEGSVAPPGLAAWLVLHDALPVFSAVLAPGERQRVPALPGHAGPRLLATGLDGSWSLDGDVPACWRVPLPTGAERSAQWLRLGVAAQIASELGARHRLTASRIAELCRAAAAQGPSLDGEALHRAARQQRSELGTLAEALPDDVPDEALVLPPGLRAELERVLQRCRLREALADGLGPSSRTRYRPGVRVLLVGPSGTGKTLSAGWMATRLSLPLYRVDLAAVTSKYIGETEKNLAELFARAEHDEVVLLFDEADALFGKRTEVKDANDRFANQQTNYLLQRIEAYEGIVVLTSNSRSRFDSAFTRRLDAIVEFAQPGPAERRALWQAHLGDAHLLAPADLNRLAAGCDLAGGHIRNVVLAARAGAGGGPIAGEDLAAALVAEYRKLGKSAPADLLPRSG
jgi:hypothetical protein